MPASPSQGRPDRLGKIGIWSGALRYGDPAQTQAAAAELDELGYGAIWIPGGAGGDVLAHVGQLLAATRRAAIATGIINIWKHEPAEICAWWRALADEHKARVMLGLGVSHGQLIGDAYRHPLAAMRAYLDKLDAEGVPRERLCLAALGPKMLALARERTAGAHPYLVTPTHTAMARKALGGGELLAPEQGLILEQDRARALDLARKALALYMRLPNYTNNWRRLGFSEEDVTQPSDRLCEGMFAMGGVEAAAQRVQDHLAAGADHVCLQVIGANPATGDIADMRQAWRRLAAKLL